VFGDDRVDLLAALDGMTPSQWLRLRPTVGVPGWPIALPSCFVPYSLTITTNVSGRPREDG
jgi:hypothetical protein